jgi:hypothetical protein
MDARRDDFVERVRDDGQWFDRGLRVEITRPASERSPGRIQKAVLGAYEVLDCEHEDAGGQACLVVRLRRFVHW